MSAAPQAAAHSDPLWVFYDGECRMCSSAVAWALARDRDRALHLVPYQSGAARARLGAEHALRAASELAVWSPRDGLRFGADAMAELLIRLPGWGVAGAALTHPLLRPIGRAVYRWVAARRRGWGAAGCPLPRQDAG